MTMPRILAFSGSLRADSLNHKLVAVAAEGARAAGAEVTLIRLKDYPLPVFDEDLEKAEGLPANARKLKDLFLSQHGLLIACPEYNSTISAALKNVIDWVSRPAKLSNGQAEPPLGCFTDKIAGIMAASPGALGGIRMLPELRRILANINVHVVHNQFALMKAHEAFSGDGMLKDEKQAAMAKGVGAAVANMLRRVVG